jgi:osmotically-inducible protein OsmY
MKADEKLAGYLAERLRAELARDPLVGRLGVEIVVVGGRVVLRGEVATLERKQRMAEAVARLVPDLQVDDEVRVRALSEPEREILQ